MSTLYTHRLDDAVAFALDAFRTRRRKGTSIPYITHLLQVMVTVGEHGGDEDQLIAAVLHDWLEDVEGADAAVLEARWGPRVRALVQALSDSTGHPKPPWKARKLAYLAHLGVCGPEVRLISAADKLHNCRSIRRDLATVGDAVWSRFSAPRDETLWYYDAVTVTLGQGWAHPLHHELRREVDTLHQEARG